MIPLYKREDTAPVAKLEQAVCNFTGAEYCIATSSGTSALLALVLAEKNRDAFCIPDVHFHGTYSAFYYGCNLDELYWIGVGPEGVIREGVFIPSDSLAVIQHTGCLLSPLPDVNAFVVEDASHMFGAFYEDGVSRVGNSRQSDATVFSLHASKTISAGEGGLVTTNNLGLYERLHEIINLGKSPGNPEIKGVPPGLNFRMNPFGAKRAYSQIPIIDALIEDRHRIINRYSELLSDIGVEYQERSPYNAGHLIIVYVDDRDNVKKKLMQKGIETSVHYPLYPYTGLRSHLYADRCLSLPLYVGMKDIDIINVVSVFKEIISG